MFELATIYRLTKYPLPVSVKNSTLPCLAAPSFVYPFSHQLQFTIHIVPLLDGRQKPLKPGSILLHVPNGPLLTPRPLRSTVREFLSQRHPTSSPSSVPKAGGRSGRMLDINSEIQMPDTPNAGHTEFPTSSFRHPGTCHRKAMVHLRRMGQSLALQRAARCGTVCHTCVKDQESVTFDFAERTFY